MDKIIGMGNALVDVLVRIDDDSLLEKLHLPKGSMQLIQEDTLSEIRKYTSGMKIHRSTVVRRQYGLCTGRIGSQSRIYRKGRSGRDRSFLWRYPSSARGKCLAGHLRFAVGHCVDFHFYRWRAYVRYLSGSSCHTESRRLVA